MGKEDASLSVIEPREATRQEVPIFASPGHRTRKTKVTTGGGPVTKFDVLFKDLSVSVRDRKDPMNRKQILNNVSGYVKAGDMLMVLGSSGSGKSMLLQSISNVTKEGTEVSGEVLFNSQRLRRNDRRQILSFVPQEAPLMGEFTVHETLWFAARLYFGYNETPKFVIQQKIDSIIHSLGLDSCKDVVVGNLFFRGLSGGQKKRLSIAIELISSPAVLVLDEPTTGVDSFVALQLVQTLHNLSRLGHTIIVTIHQPSSKIWATFNNILLMSQGRQVYFGAASKSLDYFALMGYQCPDRFNPADYFSAILSQDFPWESQPGMKQPTVEELAEMYNTSALRHTELTVHIEEADASRKPRAHEKVMPSQGSARHLVGTEDHQATARVEPADIDRDESKADDEHLDEVISKAAASESKTVRRSFSFINFKAGRFVSVKQSGFIFSTATLLHRFLKSLYREPGLLLTRIVVYLALGLIIGLVYLHVGRSFDTESMLGRSSVLLGMVGFFSFLSISAIPFIQDSRVVIELEQRNGSYSIASFVLARVMSLVPATLVLTCIASMFVGAMCDMNNFGYFFLSLWNLLFCIECLIQAVGSMFNRIEAGTALALGMFAVLFLCSGFFVPVTEMNWVIRWIAYVSPMRYAFRAFMRNEFDSIVTSNSLQFPNGKAVIEFYDLNSDLIRSYWGDMGIVFVLSIVYVLALYCFISIRMRR